MDYYRLHQGNVRQKLREDEAEDVETYGVSARLKVPEIALPGDTEQTQLYGDVEGSPYSRNPGEISLAEANARVTGRSKEGEAAEERQRQTPPPPSRASRA